jgi:hypothetical protein
VDAEIAELVRAYNDSIPHATRWRRVMTRAVPDADEGIIRYCPLCRRRLPRFSPAPSSTFGVASGHPLRQELVDACLVDGPRADDARPITLASLVEAAVSVADALEHAAWTAWATSLRQTCALGAEPIGQALEVLRQFGPVSPAHALAVLVASSGPYWTPQPDPEE